MIAQPIQVMAVLEEESNLNEIMEQMPKNLSMDKSVVGACENDIEMDTETISDSVAVNVSEHGSPKSLTHPVEKPSDAVSETKLKLSFSVDRLLNCEQTPEDLNMKKDQIPDGISNCCENVYSCCSYPSCLVGSQHEIHQRPQLPLKSYQNSSLHGDLSKFYQRSTMPGPFGDCKPVLRPTPIRAMGNNCDTVSLCAPFPALTSSLIRFHHQQQQQKHSLSQHHPHPHSHEHHPQTHASLTLSPLMAPLNGLKSLQINQHPAQQHFRQTSPNRFQAKALGFVDNMPAAAVTASLANHHHHQQQQIQNQQQQQTQLQLTSSTGGSSMSRGNNNNNNSNNISNGKRKRSWSRAVFSNLQRKGLEIQFQQQKYITKPDRRKLAARLNLTDAQVKVWFQNRRMKWRHTRENLKSGQEKQIPAPTVGSSSEPGKDKPNVSSTEERPELGYSTDGSSSVEMSENEEDDDEIDVVE